MKYSIAFHRLNLSFQPLICQYFYLVGAAGFEPATSCSQSKRATKLRYAPILDGSIGRRDKLSVLRKPARDD